MTKSKNEPYGVILSCKGLHLTKQEVTFFSKINPFGFILFSRNFKSKKQLVELIKSLKTVSINQAPLIFVDQEGGRVQRFKNNEFIKYPPQKFFGDIYDADKKRAEKLSYINARLIAYELKEVGVDVNCSPVLDVFFQNGDEIIGNRSFSSDPEIVTTLAKSYCEGFRDGGILPVIKHFPGHGRANVDSHIDLPIISESLEDLEKIDLVPFRSLKSENLLMVAHILYENIDQKIAPYSKKLMTGLLEESIKFNGLIISDDLSMLALKGSIIERTKNCFKGGCDIVLYCSGNIDEMTEIYDYCDEINKKKFEYFEKCMKKINVRNINVEQYLNELNESGAFNL